VAGIRVENGRRCKMAPGKNPTRHPKRRAKRPLAWISFAGRLTIFRPFLAFFPRTRFNSRAFTRSAFALATVFSHRKRPKSSKVNRAMDRLETKCAPPSLVRSAIFLYIGSRFGFNWPPLHRSERSLYAPVRCR